MLLLIPLSNLMKVWLFLILGVLSQKRKCPDGSDNKYCCLAVEAELPQYLKAEIDEDARLGERVNFITEDNQIGDVLPLYTDSEKGSKINVIISNLFKKPNLST